MRDESEFDQRGTRLTPADVAVMPVTVRLEDFNLGASWPDKPAVAHRLELIRARSAFKPTYYRGSLLTENCPHFADLRSQQAEGKC